MRHTKMEDEQNFPVSNQSCPMRTLLVYLTSAIAAVSAETIFLCFLKLLPPIHEVVARSKHRTSLSNKIIKKYSFHEPSG